MDAAYSQERHRELTVRRRRTRFFLLLEVVTVACALAGIGVYADFLGTLAGISYHFGRYTVAETLFKQALWVREKAYGPKNPALSDALNAMAYFYYDRDQIEKALPLAERSLAICQANLGPKDPRRAWTLSVTSLVYDGSGNFAEAERMAREALPILEAAYGQQSFEVASTLNRLGLALDGEGRLPEAEASLQRALAIREVLLGPDWDGLLPILHNLTRVYSEEGKEQEAAASRQRAERIAAHNGFGVQAAAAPASETSDFEGWQARPKLDAVAVQTPKRRIDPCLFIVPPGASNQPVASGSIGECLMLVPDGTELNLYEVFLWSGNFVPIKTDLYVLDFMPLAFTRVHVVDSLARREHKYFRDVYDPHFYWDPQPYRFVEWFLPDGISIKYERNSSGLADEHPIWSQVYYDTNVPLPLFKGSRVNWTGSTWDMSLQHGATYLFDRERGSLVGIFDKNGNEIHLVRKPNGDLTEITSPNGNWIHFSQENGLISSAVDSTRNSVNYTYDERHRLKRVTNLRGETTEYEYNLFNHIDRIVDSKGSGVLEIGYAPHDRENKVVQLSLPDGSKFQIDYCLDNETGVGHIDITDPKKKITRVTMNPKPGENDSFYTVEKLAGEQNRSRLSGE